jgi:hypothetical protein
VNKKVVVTIVALGALTIALAAQVASASHPRPKGATPIRVPFVPAFQQCTTANSTHGAPLQYDSCKPPVQTSPNLTIGSPDANGAGANAIGFAQIDVHAGVPGPPDDSDVLLAGSATDIRCKTGVAACGSANSADGPDYTGEVQSNGIIRISDHYNGGTTSDTGTVQDIPFPTTVPCMATTSTTIGATCGINTSANATIPGAVKDGKRAVIEVMQIQASDGGLDGLVSTTDNTLFAVQGVFIP